MSDVRADRPIDLRAFRLAVLHCQGMQAGPELILFGSAVLGRLLCLCVCVSQDSLVCNLTVRLYHTNAQ